MEKPTGFGGTPSAGTLRQATTIAILLAGGNSSRMGHDKALLSWEGELLLDRALRILAQTVGESGAVLLSSPPREGLFSIPDEDPERRLGPFAGIRSTLFWLERQGIAVSSLRDKVFLVSGVDMPGLTPELGRTLIEALKKDTTKSSVHYAGHVLPMGIRITSHIQCMIQSIPFSPASAKTPALKSLLGEDLTLKLPVPPGQEGAFANINTHLEWKNWTSRS